MAFREVARLFLDTGGAQGGGGGGGVRAKPEGRATILKTVPEPFPRW